MKVPEGATITAVSGYVFNNSGGALNFYFGVYRLSPNSTASPTSHYDATQICNVATAVSVPSNGNWQTATPTVTASVSVGDDQLLFFRCLLPASASARFEALRVEYTFTKIAPEV